MAIQKKGIDISKYQGKVDFKTLKDEVDFVIIRAGYGAGNYDSMLERNVTECSNNGIDYGLYWFSYALTPEAGKKEADYILDKIERLIVVNALKPPTYPICFDYEQDSYNNAKKKNVAPTKTVVQEIAKAFLDRVESRGYYAMLYTNIDFWNRGFGNLSSKYDIWLAQWKVSKPSKSCGIWQKSSEGKVKGINGNVDLDIAYKDYPVIIKNMKKKEEKEDEKKEENKEEKKVQVITEYVDKYLALADAVIAGDWGNGAARKRALNNSGYDYNFVQSLVDAILK